MNKTPIEYLDYTWNPIAMRCTPVSAACANCWHLRMANRMAGMKHFPPEVRAAYAGEGPPVLIRYRLEEPLKRGKSARIGVQFMGDLFHEDIPNAFIADVLKTIHQASWHIFQILTKRPRRALDFIQRFYGEPTCFPDNVWLGVSAENQQAADERIPLLLQTPAAVRFVSCEPLLEETDLHLHSTVPKTVHNTERWRATHEFIKRVIVGGETGPGARPMHPDWARSLRNQAQEAGVPFFFKSWGEWQPVDQSDDIVPSNTPEYVFPDGAVCFRVGKARAGHLLDGEEWREFPK